MSWINFMVDLEPVHLCTELNMIWTIMGYIILAIQLVVPLLLIVTGMITMAHAVMEKDEKAIKTAQNVLVKKLIAAVITFLIIAVVKIIVGLVVTDDSKWESCVTCALSPYSDGCGIEKATIDTN